MRKLRSPALRWRVATSTQGPDLPAAGLLFGPELPGLITWHGDVAPDRDDSILMHCELNLIAFADVQCLPDRIGQGELRLLAKSRARVGPRSYFFLGTSLVHG